MDDRLLFESNIYHKLIPSVLTKMRDADQTFRKD